MYTKLIGMVLTAALQAAAPASGTGHAGHGSSAIALPPAPASAVAQDAAEALYRQARGALAESRFEAAAQLFGRLAAEHPRSSYAPDALYWQAYSLTRIGGDERLRQAAELLARQEQRYPRAATRQNGEAMALATRIQGELARLGDPAAGARVSAAAGRVAESACDGQQQEMRVAALNALLHMNADQALPILRDVLQRRDACSMELREKAAFLVSQTRRPETVEILVGVARNDPSPNVRQKAVFWLSQVNDPRAVDALVDVLARSQDDELREKALFALSQHSSAEARAALRAATGDRSMPVELRKKAIFWLSQQRGGDTDFLKQLYGRLDDNELRERVLFAVSQTRDAGRGEWLMAIALDEEQPMELRKKAIFWAGEGGAPIEQLVQLYDRMQDREMRERLLFVYAQRREPAALDKLIDVARRERDQDLRKRAVFWLGQSKDPRAAQALLEIING